MIFYVFFLQPIELYSGPSPPEGLVCEATGLVLTLCICETYFAKWGIFAFCESQLVRWGVTEEDGMFLPSILQKVLIFMKT